MCTFDFHNQDNVTYDSQVATSKPNSSIIEGPRWKPGQTIKIKFLNGDTTFQERVKEDAKEWTDFANLTFEYVPVTQYADIRISFRWEGDSGDWSRLGNSSTTVISSGQNRPSMNFGWFSLGNKSSTKSTVLHEFGHALGLHHEHQSPASNIPWNLPKVYKHFGDQGWSKEETDRWIINKYNSSNTTNFSEYDLLSIMHYYIPRSLRTDGIVMNSAEDLSPTDKSFINRIYPKPNLHQEEYFDKSSKIVTSKNGMFSLIIRSEKLVIYNNFLKKDLWHLSPNIKFNNATSTNVYCLLRGGQLLLFKGSVSRLATGDKSIAFAEYATLTDSGDIELIKNNIAVWSLFKGKLN